MTSGRRPGFLTAQREALAGGLKKEGPGQRGHGGEIVGFLTAQREALAGGLKKEGPGQRGHSGEIVTPTPFKDEFSELPLRDGAAWIGNLVSRFR